MDAHRAEHPAAMAKSGANYMNSQLIKMEAIVNGFAEGIALDINGFVSEGSGENVFIVHHDKLIPRRWEFGAARGSPAIRCCRSRAT